MNLPHELIPIVALVMIFGMPIAIVAIIFVSRSRDRAEMQKTVRAAIEKGETLPPEFLESLQRAHPKAKNPMNDIRAGLILVAIASGFIIWGYIDDGAFGGDFSGIAAIPGLIGIALLILGIIGLNRKQ
jgi:hypothetical protein